MGSEILDHWRTGVGAIHFGETMNKLPTIEDMLQKPATINDAITTLRDLVADLKAHPDDWENTSLEQYLLAMAAWLESFHAKLGEPNWRVLVTALEAAKIYE